MALEDDILEFAKRQGYDEEKIGKIRERYAERLPDLEIKSKQEPPQENLWIKQCLSKIWQDITGITPEYVIKEWYAPCVKQGWLGGLQLAQRIARVKIPEHTAQEWYADYIKEERLDELEKLLRIIEIKPSEKIVQEGYIAYAKAGKLRLVKKLYEITATKPSDHACREILKLLENKA